MVNKVKKVKLGFAPTRRNVFSTEDANKYKKLIYKKIKADPNIEVIDIENINNEGMLITDSDIEAVIRKFKVNEVDCIFSPHCNFGTESSVGKVAKEIGKPFLLWGPRDEAPLADGTRLRDSQCGLFATSKVLQRMSVPYTYIINSRIDDAVFQSGFSNFIKAAYVVKNFRKMKVGQIGVRPQGFWTVMFNESELLEKFNIQVVPFEVTEVIDIAKEIIKKNNQKFKDTIDFVKHNIHINIKEQELTNIIGLKEAINKIAAEHNISCFAIQCWDLMQKIIGVVPCLANSLLADEKLPIACETDIYGAISSRIAQAASMDEEPVFFADLTIRHPEDDNAELLWHCGAFPYSIRKDGQKGAVAEHFVLNNNPPGACHWQLKEGEISIVRFDELKNKYSLFVGEGKSTNGPKNKGTYLWMRVKDWSWWEEKFIYGPYIHHVACIYTKIGRVLKESFRYIDDINFDFTDLS